MNGLPALDETFNVPPSPPFCYSIRRPSIRIKQILQPPLYFDKGFLTTYGALLRMRSMPNLTHYFLSRHKRHFRQGLAIGGILLLSLLTQCGKKEEPPPPQAEKPQSLMEQYKGASKATAENPGLAASPGQTKAEEKGGK